MKLLTWIMVNKDTGVSQIIIPAWWDAAVMQQLIDFSWILQIKQLFCLTSMSCHVVETPLNHGLCIKYT